MDTIETRPRLWSELSTTPHGRVLCAAIAVALVGGGIGAAMRDGIGAGIMSGALIGAVTLTLFSVGLSIGRRPSFGLMAMITLPAPFFAYSLVINIIEHGAKWAAYPLMLVGALFASVAVFGGPVQRRRPRGGTIVHAH